MSEYEAGQVWSYQSRPQDEGSRLVVLKIDDEAEAGRIVHVFLDGLSVQNPGAMSGRSTEILHMPFAAEEIDKSVVTLLGTEQLPDFQEGYDLWRDAFEKGEAGVYTVSPAEAVQLMEETLNQ